jgi:hypothetical protein
VVGLDKKCEDVREGKRIARRVIAEQRGLGASSSGPRRFRPTRAAAASTRSATRSLSDRPHAQESAVSSARRHQYPAALSRRGRRNMLPAGGDGTTPAGGRRR